MLLFEPGDYIGGIQMRRKHRVIHFSDNPIFDHQSYAHNQTRKVVLECGQSQGACQRLPTFEHDFARLIMRITDAQSRARMWAISRRLPAPDCYRSKDQKVSAGAVPPRAALPGAGSSRRTPWRLSGVNRGSDPEKRNTRACNPARREFYPSPTWAADRAGRSWDKNKLLPSPAQCSA